LAVGTMQDPLAQGEKAALNPEANPQ
jgi:hypothetical protein